MKRLVLIFLTALEMFCAKNATAAPAKWWNTTTFYEIFVRSFQDSDGDGIGDLRGITSRLDYLNNREADTVVQPKSLGVKGIWLTPIFASPSYHGYDATNYKEIDPKYGSMDDFRAFIREAHRRGIKVILDIAVNHTSVEHPWFKDAMTSPQSKYRDWYVWRKDKPKWGHWIQVGDWYYYSFFSETMPNLNWRNPSVLAAVKDILRFWMQQGVDGFRLDAARYYAPGPNGEADTVETHHAIAQFATTIRNEFPNVLFVGEIWADAATINSYTASGKELDLGFNFPMAFGLVPTLNTENPASFKHALQEYQNVFRNPYASSPFLTNHDMVRSATELYEYLPKMKLAAEIYFMLPGTPFVYYGEELGFPNGNGSGDYEKRMPMQWSTASGFGFTNANQAPWQPFFGKANVFSVEAQLKQKSGLLELYKKLIHFRNNTPLMSVGSLDHIQSLPNVGVMMWRRIYQGKAAIVVVNFSYKAVPSFALNPSMGNYTRIVKTLYASQNNGLLNAEAFRDGSVEIPALEPHSVNVFQVE